MSSSSSRAACGTPTIPAILAGLADPLNEGRVRHVTRGMKYLLFLVLFSGSGLACGSDSDESSRSKCSFNALRAEQCRERAVSNAFFAGKTKPVLCVEPLRTEPAIPRDGRCDVVHVASDGSQTVGYCCVESFDINDVNR